MTRVLVAAISTRAAAESAARAGYAVTAVDAFADLDQHPAVRSISLPRDMGQPFTASAVARAAHHLDCDAVVYGSSFENHPRAVAALAAGRPLWGNPPAVLRRVRNPALLAATLRARGFCSPAVVMNPNVSNDQNESNVSNAFSNDSNESNGSNVSNEWIVKPLHSGGGRRVRRWHPGDPVPRGHYRQAFVSGAPGSIVFVAAGGAAVSLALSRQLIGDPAFGAAGFAYCGSVISPAGDGGCDEGSASALAHAVAGEFDLVGVNGVDFVWSDGAPYAIEVNPRWCGSMELAERLYGLSIFAAHAEACANGRLPRFSLARARQRSGAVGKAIVYARQPVTAGDTGCWLADENVRDVPHPGERFRAGQPVCTVFADGRDGAACYAALAGKADEIYRQLEAWSRAVA